MILSVFWSLDIERSSFVLFSYLMPCVCTVNHDGNIFTDRITLQPVNTVHSRPADCVMHPVLPNFMLCGGSLIISAGAQSREGVSYSVKAIIYNIIVDIVGKPLC